MPESSMADANKISNLLETKLKAPKPWRRRDIFGKDLGRLCDKGRGSPFFAETGTMVETIVWRSLGSLEFHCPLLALPLFCPNKPCGSQLFRDSAEDKWDSPSFVQWFVFL